MNSIVEKRYVVNTAISSQYFSAALNLIGSIHKNSPCVAWVNVWDLGLAETERIVLKNIINVNVIEIPEFVSNWKDGYTWKLYMYKQCPSDIVFGIDAKSTVWFTQAYL